MTPWTARMRHRRRPHVRGKSDAEWGHRLGATCVDLQDDRAVR